MDSGDLDLISPNPFIFLYLHSPFQKMEKYFPSL